LEKGLPYDKIIEMLMRKGKIQKTIWETINKSILKHIPAGEREGALMLIATNGGFYLKTPKIEQKIDATRGAGPAKEKWNRNMQEAAYKVRDIYEADMKSSTREYKDLKDASNQFFDSHVFTKYPIERLKKENFYELVKKSGGVSVKEREP
jgi:hypothetical protein